MKNNLKEMPAQKSAAVDENIFRDRMRQPDIVSEFFFPLGHAAWHRGRFSINKDEIAQVSTKISGVRLQAADPRGENPEPERQCRQDVVNLVQSLIRLRETPALSNIVLSDEIHRGVNESGSRVKFGLYLDPTGRYSNETEAAHECHSHIVRAVQKSGLVIDSPKTFEQQTGMDGLLQWANQLSHIVRAVQKSALVIESPKTFEQQTGMDGLLQWANQLRLRRRRKIWLLALLLLLLLLFSLRDCSPPKIFVPIETQSFIIIMDKSSSMEPHFSAVQAEARKTLEKMRKSFFAKHYANVIAYHFSATSALGGIKEVNNETGQQLIFFLDNIKAEGGTNLRAGIELAAKEVAAHQKPTTLLIFTDGEDTSVAEMLQDVNPILSQFQGVEIVGNTLTPRVFSGVNPKPINELEQKLSELAAALNGHFGNP
ncbi:MAG: hypothetical protein DRR08_28105 [Candidatus Parabeggiatoa sp. nov. 2]|nr:MAG: hypothetical protein B6247_03345 [Beggiatoa sp. 4572_84]RKZ52630.1 MAG: hypothetical protein DRR08_28105 [Gammaproteobacteria bacterium]